MKKINLFAILIIAALLSLTYISFREHDGVYFFISVIFYFLIFIFQRNLKSSNHSEVAFLLYLCLLPIYQLFLVNIHGTFFTLGGDAEYYYNSAYAFFENENTLVKNRFWLFIYIVGNYFKVVEFLGGEISPTYLSIFSIFMSSICFSLIFTAIENLHGRNIAKKVITLWLFTPLIIYLSVGQLRDVYSYVAPSYLFYYLSLSRDKKANLIRVTSLIGLIIYSSYIRMDVTFFCLVMLAFYSVFDPENIKSSYKKLFILGPLLLLLFIGLSGLSTFEKQVSSQALIEQVQGYNERCEFACDDNSFIKKLRTSALGLFVLPIFAYFTPLPDFVLSKNYTIIHFLEMVFFVAWFYFAIFFFLGSLKLLKSKFYLSFIFCFYISVIFSWYNKRRNI